VKKLVLNILAALFLVVFLGFLIVFLLATGG
jgi:hypothetical protein